MSPLLQLALALLIAAQQPNVPPELRAQAVTVADYAISVATQVESVPMAPAPIYEPVVAELNTFEDERAEIDAERTALIAERDALHRKAEEMGGSRDTIAGYKRYLTQDVKERMEALNEREKALRDKYGI